MSKTQQTEDASRDNHRILAYMNHLARTAQQADDKRLFTAFAQQAKRRIEASGQYRTLADGQGLGGDQTQHISETVASPAPGSRV